MIYMTRQKQNTKINKHSIQIIVLIISIIFVIYNQHYIIILLICILSLTDKLFINKIHTKLPCKATINNIVIKYLIELTLLTSQLYIIYLIILYLYESIATILISIIISICTIYITSNHI
jgi:hypothetical protein